MLYSILDKIVDWIEETLLKIDDGVDTLDEWTDKVGDKLHQLINKSS